MIEAKFADHLPLYRQAVIYARDGVDPDRALLASWVGAASALLRPLVDAIRDQLKMCAGKIDIQAAIRGDRRRFSCDRKSPSISIGRRA